MKTILLTNDDGISSFGLLALKRAVEGLGRIEVVAPLKQHTTAGRAVTRGKAIRHKEMKFDGLKAYGVDATPSSCIIFAMEGLGMKPDIVLSGINYGENIGIGVTASGTVGACFEAASAYSLPAIAVSVTVHPSFQLDSWKKLDFCLAKKYARSCAEHVLEHGLPGSVKILNVNIPVVKGDPGAEITRLSTVDATYPYLTKDRRIEYRFGLKFREKDTDLYCIYKKKKVSISPIAFDLNVRDFSSVSKRLSNMVQRQEA